MKGKFAAVAGYGDEELKRLPADAVQNSFGCGNPLAFAGVRAGQTVLDIGSGAGIDCLIAAGRVGLTGKVIGLDMTPEMIERARRNAREAGAKNVEFRLGEAEKMPVEDETVDWLISNCVINLSTDKPAVFREVARVLKPGGRISISDIVAEELPEAIRRSRDAWTGCLAGAIGEADYVKGLKEAGLRDLRVTSRIVYEASQLRGLFASSCCGISAEAGLDATALAEAAAGKIWSARFEGVRPHPASVLADVMIEPAARGDLAGVQSLLAGSGLPTDVEGHLETFLVARHDGRLVGCVGIWRSETWMRCSAPWRSRRPTAGRAWVGASATRWWSGRSDRGSSGRIFSPRPSPHWPRPGGSAGWIVERLRRRSVRRISSTAPAAPRPWRCGGTWGERPSSLRDASRLRSCQIVLDPVGGGIVYSGDLTVHTTADAIFRPHIARCLQRQCHLRIVWLGRCTMT
jgi:SAM-dependent methyltransferase